MRFLLKENSQVWQPLITRTQPDSCSGLRKCNKSTTPRVPRRRPPSSLARAFRRPQREYLWRLWRLWATMRALSASLEDRPIPHSLGSEARCEVPRRGLWGRPRLSQLNNVTFLYKFLVVLVLVLPNLNFTLVWVMFESGNRCSYLLAYHSSLYYAATRLWNWDWDWPPYDYLNNSSCFT